MKTIFVSHPFSSDPPVNVQRVAVVSRQIVLAGHLPLAPHLFLPLLLSEATERALALRLCLRMVALSDEVRVYGEPTQGMLMEIAEAKRLGIPVVRGDLE